MASAEHKVQVLRRFVATFSGWLDTCEQLLLEIPGQTEVKASDAASLRDLALRFKVCRVCVCACVCVCVRV